MALDKDSSRWYEACFESNTSFSLDGSLTENRSLNTSQPLQMNSCWFSVTDSDAICASVSSTVEVKVNVDLINTEGRTCQRKGAVFQAINSHRELYSNSCSQSRSLIQVLCTQLN